MVTDDPEARRAALVIPPRPTIEPTERSIPPLMRRRARGTETIPIIETCSATKRKLSKLRNRSFWIAKNTIRSNSASESALSTRRRILRNLVSRYALVGQGPSERTMLFLSKREPLEEILDLILIIILILVLQCMKVCMIEF